MTSAYPTRKSVVKILYLTAEDYGVNVELIVNDNKVSCLADCNSSDFVIKTDNSSRVS